MEETYFQKGPDVPMNTVLLYQMGRAPTAPSVSPFPLKLETYLRMANIPYMNDHSVTFSSKGKIPWMMYNGKKVADSQFCIEYLNKKLGLNLNKDVSDLDLAIGRAFQKMSEEELYWYLITFWKRKGFTFHRKLPLFVNKSNRRFFDIRISLTMCAATFGDDLTEVKKVLPYKGIELFIKLNALKYVVNKEMHGHGIGRHTYDEIWSIGEKDMRALSTFMGTKKFFLGDEPCEVDCSIFAILIMINLNMKNSKHEKLLKTELKNMEEYCIRMKERFWPDWDECCKQSDKYQNDSYIQYIDGKKVPK